MSRAFIDHPLSNINISAVLSLIEITLYMKNYCHSVCVCIVTCIYLFLL